MKRFETNKHLLLLLYICSLVFSGKPILRLKELSSLCNMNPEPNITAITVHL